MIKNGNNQNGVKNMSKKQYNNFSDIYGNDYSFSDYMTFAKWFFGITRRELKMALDSETFRRLNYEACNSREARTPAF